MKGKVRTKSMDDASGAVSGSRKHQSNELIIFAKINMLSEVRGRNPRPQILLRTARALHIGLPNAPPHDDDDDDDDDDHGSHCLAPRIMMPGLSG